MLIFAVLDFFSQSFITFSYSLYIKGTFLCFTLMAKIIVPMVRGDFLTKNNSFFTPSKKITVYIRNKKKGFSIFLTVVERYSKSFMQTNWRKIHSKSPW